MYTIDQGEGKADASCKIAIIAPRFNSKLVDELKDNCLKELHKKGILESQIRTYEVGGSLEIPLAAKVISEGKFSPDAIIALGVVIRGETTHYDLVSETSYQGIMAVQLSTKIPVIFGILTCENLEQVTERISESKQNKGKDFANAALMQIQLIKDNQ